MSWFWYCGMALQDVIRGPGQKVIWGHLCCFLKLHIDWQFSQKKRQRKKEKKNKKRILVNKKRASCVPVLLRETCWILCQLRNSGASAGCEEGREVREGRKMFYVFPAAAAAAKSLQSCLTLCDPMDGSPSGSPVPGILQARTLEWVAISFSNEWQWKVKVKSLCRVQLLETPWTVAYQAPPSMGFSRQEYWSGVPLPSPMYSLERPMFLCEVDNCSEITGCQSPAKPQNLPEILRN